MQSQFDLGCSHQSVDVGILRRGSVDLLSEIRKEIETLIFIFAKVNGLE